MNITTIPDNKGGQLKFRVDSIGLGVSHDTFLNTISEGSTVDIYINDAEIIFMPRSISMAMLNRIMLIYGRPKGFGQVLWIDGSYNYQILWTPHIGDEGYFNDT